MSAPLVAVLGGTVSRRLYAEALLGLGCAVADAPDAAGLRGVVAAEQQADPAVLPRTLPALLDIPTFAAATAAATPGRWWLPNLPLRHAVDVLAAEALLARGELGPARSAHLVTLVGAVESPHWDLDAPRAGSPLEAAVWGLDVLETLVGGTVVETRWLRPLSDPAGAVGVHRVDGGVVATHEIVRAAACPGPAFEAAVACDGGRLYLRAPFAPGALAVWTSDPPGFHVPSIPITKPNVQAPDSVPAGWETRRVLEQLLQPDPATIAKLQADALRYLALVAAR